jgi:hypothetical protein
MVRYAVLLLLLSVCTSDIESYRLVRFLGWLCDSSGVSAPGPASASASARMRSLQLQRPVRCQAVLRCTAAAAFGAIGLTEFLVAFRRGLAEARKVSVAFMYMST